MKYLGLDTETTGLSFTHGCKPFFISCCERDGSQRFWEWDVDPLTRQPIIPDEDLDGLLDYLDEFDRFVIQNSGFDIQALCSILPQNLIPGWDQIEDTLIASHILASAEPHDLESLCIQYLGIRIGTFEKHLEDCVKSARRLARSRYPEWRIAREGEETLPRIKGSSSGKEGKTWKNDLWLPKALAIAEDYDPDHEWFHVTREYGNSDSAVLVPLYEVLMEHLDFRELRSVYNSRMEVLPVIDKMQNTGVTFSMPRLEALDKQYRNEIEDCHLVAMQVSQKIAKQKPEIKVIEQLPAGMSNDLRNLLFDGLELPVVKRTDKGGPSTDKFVLEEWKLTSDGIAYDFVSALQDFRKRKTARGYLDGYRRFCLLEDDDFYKLFPSYNSTGSDTLRFSSQYPNAQNISKKEGFNLRQIFGPTPGRVWFSIDYNNIELRLPAYEAGEEAIIELFERPDDPPYFGSFHLLVSHILHPKEFEDCLRTGESFKDKYKSTLYQWTKNGNFAVQYGAMESSGTADRAYRVEGGQRKVQKRLERIADLNADQIRHANKHGYVYTIKDHDIGSSYPIQVLPVEYGRIKPTQPLNYHIQGSAMWGMCKAMIRCNRYLEELNRRSNKDYHMILQVHDELVFDFPDDPKGNPPKIRKIKQLMELSGTDFEIPLTVSSERHDETWAIGV
jgi:DNA polymerase I-like protein with 3'-5' exonuclease and polymerase domains